MPERGIDPEEIIAAVRTRRAPMTSVSAGLRLWPTAGSGSAPAVLPLPLRQDDAGDPRGARLEPRIDTLETLAPIG